MSWDVFVDLFQIAAAVATVVVIFLAMQQARAFGALELLGILQDEQTRAGRRHIYQTQERRRDGEELAFDSEELARVAMSFDMAGVLLKRRFAPRSVFIPAYAIVVVRCYLACEPLLHEREKTFGPAYWAGIKWLYGRAQNEMVRQGMRIEPWWNHKA